VKRLDAEKLKGQLLEVVDFGDTPSQFAIVLAVGNGYRKEDGGRIPLDVQVGDTIVTKPFSGASIEVELEGTILDAYMLMDSDVLAVLED
jgi:chaperonin GroES